MDDRGLGRLFADTRLRRRGRCPSTRAVREFEPDEVPATGGICRVLEKLGFVREGTLREDCVVNGEISDS